ncbi:hypothetical protein QZH41_008872, partial [Actinostola sp. cb2023]
MPAAYSSDLRLRAIWLVEFLEMDKAEVAFYLGISKRSVERYIQIFYRSADVLPRKSGRPFAWLEFHPHEELVIMEEVLRRPDATLSEIARALFQETGSQFSLSATHTYFERNGITTKKLHHIALQRSEAARVVFRANSCLLEPEMFVFLDESGFDKRICRTYGRSYRGRRAEVAQLRQDWGSRITAIPHCKTGLVKITKKKWLHNASE